MKILTKELLETMKIGDTLNVFVSSDLEHIVIYNGPKEVAVPVPLKDADDLSSDLSELCYSEEYVVRPLSTLFGMCLERVK